MLELVPSHSVALAPLWSMLTDDAVARAAPGSRDDDASLPPAHTHPLPTTAQARSGRGARRNLLLGLLKMYGAAEGTPRLCGAVRLRADCERLLGHADHRIQQAALDCLARWDVPAINRYRQQLAGDASGVPWNPTPTIYGPS